jgi:hypothetical protein
MPTFPKKIWTNLLADAQRRLPAGHTLVQEAFTSDHHHPVLIKLNELCPDTFYWFDEMVATVISQAVVEIAAHCGGGQLTVTFTAFGELSACRRRLQHVASHLNQIRILSVDRPSKDILSGARLEYFSTNGTPLAPYHIALLEGRVPLLFIAREQRSGSAATPRSLGFFTNDPETVEAVADDLKGMIRGDVRRLDTFERLQQLHETTQQIARELESYSRRIQLAVERARRRPDLLTPERFERIVTQGIAKLEQLKTLPCRALRDLSKSSR